MRPAGTERDTETEGWKFNCSKCPPETMWKRNNCTGELGYLLRAGGKQGKEERERGSNFMGRSDREIPTSCRQDPEGGKEGNWHQRTAWTEFDLVLNRELKNWSHMRCLRQALLDGGWRRSPNKRRERGNRRGTPRE